MRDHKAYNGERSSAKARWMGIATAAGIVLSASASANAQQPPPPPPPQPPPGFETAGQPPPPPGYGQPPPPPGYYGQPPPGAYYAPPGAPIMGPRVLEWEEGEPLRPGYHADTRIRKGLVIGGAVTFGTVYLLTALGTALAQTAGADSSITPLYVPAIGPFIACATIKPLAPISAFFLVFDGLIQSGGVAMFIAGLAAPQSVQVRNDAQAKPPRTFLTPVPMAFGTSSGGLGLVGKF